MGLDWSIDVPAGWERIEQLAEPLLLAARSPDVNGAFRANLTVAAHARDDDDPDVYLTETTRASLGLLERARVLEAAREDKGSAPSYGFLIAHEYEGHRLTVEQRHVWVPDGVVVASFTCPTRSFCELHGVAVEVLGSLEVSA